LKNYEKEYCQYLRKESGNSPDGDLKFWEKCDHELYLGPREKVVLEDAIVMYAPCLKECKGIPDDETMKAIRDKREFLQTISEERALQQRRIRGD
jgi:hypothetical protein